MSAKHGYLFRRLVFVLVLVVCLMLSTWVVSLPAQAASTLSRREPPFAGKLRPLLLAQMQELSVPGAIVYVNDPGQGAWTASLGTRSEAPGVPMQVKSYMRIGSITKTMTATVILQLVDRHKLGLDDPVSTYLSHVPNGAHITIRKLLNMSSGLFSYTEDLGVEQ